MKSAACLVIAAACYSPSFREGAPCSSDPDCPAPQRCIASQCTSMPRDGGELDGGDDGGGGGSGDAGDGVDLPFVPPAMQSPGSGNLTIATAATLDTTGLTLSGGLPAGVELVSSPQKISGDVAILRVAGLDVSGTLTVVGNRPLAIIAGGSVTIGGVIDASARGAIPGPGASTMDGAGGVGLPTTGTIDDSGAGGGGDGTAGAPGGDSETPMPGGAGGAVIAKPDVLVGGGSGGTGSTRAMCTPAAGGGGGGGIYIYSPSSISVTGRIAVNGAGGAGGPPCPADNALGPAGGGAGGRLELQSPIVAITTGVAVANGGGGGGGSSAGTAGLPGADGHSDATPAAGGAPAGSLGGAGGAGGAGKIAPTPGAIAPNGGGGGGAVGRIHIRYRGTQPTISASPPATFDPY